MPATVKKFNLSNLKGISDSQISEHKDILYTGYVKKLNEIEDKLKTCDISTANQVYSELRSLKTEHSFALNGVILHELYFENLATTKSDTSKDLRDTLSRDFSSIGKWENDFKASGLAARGWVILGLDRDGSLHNFCLDSHNNLVPIGTTPILVMDVYEHAYAMDYGVKRAPYIDAFMKNIDWTVCSLRFESAVTLLKIAA